MKDIFICCDGTGNEHGRNNTNVIGTCMLVEKDEDQIAYYDPKNLPAKLTVVD